MTAWLRPARARTGSRRVMALAGLLIAFALISASGPAAHAVPTAGGGRQNPFAKKG